LLFFEIVARVSLLKKLNKLRPFTFAPAPIALVFIGLWLLCSTTKWKMEGMDCNGNFETSASVLLAISH
jgi:hypothetical protein